MHFDAFFPRQFRNDLVLFCVTLTRLTFLSASENSTFWFKTTIFPVQNRIFFMETNKTGPYLAFAVNGKNPATNQIYTQKYKKLELQFFGIFSSDLNSLSSTEPLAQVINSLNSLNTSLINHFIVLGNILNEPRVRLKLS